MKKKTKWIVGIVAVLLLGVAVLGSTSSYFGAFKTKFNNQKITKGTETESTFGQLLSGGAAVEEETPIYLTVEATDRRFVYSMDDDRVAGEWVFQYSEGATPCDYMFFQRLDYEAGHQASIKNFFEGTKLFMAASVAELVEQVDNGDYIASYWLDPESQDISDIEIGLFEQQELAELPESDTYYVYLYGDIWDDLDFETAFESEESRTVYLTDICVNTPEGEFIWTDNDAYGQNKYFDMDSRAGYGVASRVEVSY